MIKFELSINIENCRVNQRDSVFLCGSARCLGEWNVLNAVEMRLKQALSPADDGASSLSSLSSISSSSCELLLENQTLEFEALVDGSAELCVGDGVHHYKYFIAQKTSQKDQIFLKQVEYGWRELSASGNSSEIAVVQDRWPYYGADSKQVRVDNGWLLSGESEFQLHFFNNPLQVWIREEGDEAQRKYAIEVKAWKTGSTGIKELRDYVLSHVDFDENQTVHDRLTHFNALNEPNVYTSFRFRSYANPSELMFQVNIYELNEYGMPAEKHAATSYFKVNRALLESSSVEVDLSLLNSNLIVGSLRVEIVTTTSLNEPQNYLITKNFNYHFKESCIPIGHRGMGKTFDADSLPSTYFVENTIESFREAHNRGAQMVEFDVVLTKDKIPIIYHDFTFCIDHQQQSDLLNANQYIDIAVNQLTYNEIKQNRIYSHKILKKSSSPGETFTSDSFTSKLMFPTLREMCAELDSKLGFNVEIKYPLDLEDGTHEAGHYIKWLNRNEYVDVIIKDLYECCKDDQRCVIITTFDPNLCSMLRMKQNKFPVLFLTNGKTEKYVPYKDFRCKNTQISFNYARAEGLHGIVAHSEELVRNLHLISIIFNHTAKTRNFWAYSWGDDLNELEKRQLFTQHGINGLIYDRIDEKSSLVQSL